MPTYLWNYAAKHTCRLIGVGPKAPDWTTPDWKWDGGSPDVSALRTFGCRVYIHVNREIGTLDARGEEMRYLGMLTPTSTTCTVLETVASSPPTMPPLSRRTLSSLTTPETWRSSC
jgi:hypothetical protein